MAQMLGDRLLPEAVQVQRRKVRNKITDLREPIRERRQDLVPGPDVIGSIEENVSDLRSRFVSRDTLLKRVKDMSPVEDSDNGEKEEKSNSNDNGNKEKMV